MRIVDDATRAEVQSMHLDKLEADNYMEEQGAGDDDEFFDEDEEDRPARKKQQRSKGGGGGPVRSTGKWGIHWRKVKIKSLSQVLFEMSGEGVAPQARLAQPGPAALTAAVPAALGAAVAAAAAAAATPAAPSYLSIAATPSALPPRRFCSVCGFFARYACGRCGMRLCRARCQAQHRETRCLKFSA
ncbi:hypothetical protein JKP88DRAFT_332322 [Tribonema minus]|uniref:HIT-type domain-containing protein n=1 Tax=Tribonema minus TaxID=303371 RepID=A0A836CA12_9STRA|nr:hypothetical protein JKP88DRAFT_332322 [Tribonema minus]